MDMKKEIEEFIKTKEHNGALLVTGKWGCGKSYLIKEIINEFNTKRKYAVSVISLFGVDNITVLNERVKEAYLELNSSFLGKNARNVYKILKKLAKESASITAAALPESVAASAISTGVSSVLSFNPLNFVSVKNTVGTGDDKRPFVLIFDDFERTNIDKTNLLGAINEYSENKLIKTIIIADEDKISDKKYSEFKEKLISRTLKLRPNYNDIIESIIINYSESIPGYVNFLKNNLKIIQKVFEESKTENLRSLKSYLIDFERVFDAWKNSEVSTLLQTKVFYMFGAMTFSVKTGEYKEGPYGFMFADSELKKVYSDYQGNYILYTLRQWIVDGVWEKNEFVEEIRSKFKVDEMTDSEKLISYGFWDLEQKNITNGLPVVIQKAYNGELTRDQLIGLLQKLHAFKEYSVPLACEIDYQKIYEGFQIRKNKILNSEIIEPNRRTFSEKTQIDSDALALYEDITNFDNKLITYDNRRELIRYLNNQTIAPQHSFKGLIVGVLDDQLLTMFLTKYNRADNSEKRELALMFLALGFNDRLYISIDELQETSSNIESLKRELQNYNKITKDYITIAINNSFIKQLDELLKSLTES